MSSDQILSIIQDNKNDGFCKLSLLSGIQYTRDETQKTKKMHSAFAIPIRISAFTWILCTISLLSINMNFWQEARYREDRFTLFDVGRITLEKGGVRLGWHD